MSDSKDVAICRREAYHTEALCRANAVAFSQNLVPVELTAFYFACARRGQACYRLLFYTNTKNVRPRPSLLRFTCSKHA